MERATKATAPEALRAQEPSAVSAIDSLLAWAHEHRVSDIHLDPTATSLRVRMRLDGSLVELGVLSKRLHPEVIARIKVLAGMRTDEHFAAQDGRVRHTLPSGESLDVRVSIMPTYHGENAVLRVLAAHRESTTLDDMGFSPHNRKRILEALARPSGMILTTGPTGSGKTTTLYTLIAQLKNNDTSIVTIEDPIEYAIEGVEQIQVQPRTGLTFANGLRSILRQDPDVIMVGEIRDHETARIAVNTALTGHLLLSTLHTTSAAATLPRLLDMGVDAYLIASTIRLAVGQRLVRRLCSACKERTTASQDIMQAGRALICAGETLWQPRGCTECDGVGYRGRVCISEVLVVDDALREAIAQQASTTTLEHLAAAAGMVPLIEDGCAQVRAGITTPQEVLRVVYE